MVPIPRLNEEALDLLVRYSRDGDEMASTALVNAFMAANVEVFDRETTLQDWIDPDALDQHEWRSDRLIYVHTRVWGHPVVVTSEDVRIYTESAAVP